MNFSKLLALTIFILGCSSAETPKIKEMPASDWFFAQRAYPQGKINFDAYFQSLQQTKNLMNSQKNSNQLNTSPQWEQAGPTNIGGRVTAVVADPLNPNVVYAGCAVGGVLKSTNFGQNWIPVFDSTGVLSVGAITMDPLNSDVLWVGTGEANSSGDSYGGNGIYKTTNGGTTWTHSGLENSHHIGRIVVHPTNPNTVWVAALGSLFGTNSERGVYKTTDGGTTWTKQFFVDDTTGCVDLSINPQNPNELYAAFWHRIRTPVYRKVGGTTSGIYKTTDGGTTWTLLSNGLPAPSPTNGRIGVCVAPSQPSTVYAVYSDHPGNFKGVYKTTNSGTSWTELANSNDPTLSSIFSNFGWYFSTLAVNPVNHNNVVLSGVQIYQTNNGGTTWDSFDNGQMHVDHHAFWFNPIVPNQIYCGNDGGLYYTSNSGNTFTKAENFPITQFYAITHDPQITNRIYGGTQDNNTLVTLTGAIDGYESILGGDGFHCLVDPGNSNRVYAEYQWGNLYRIENGNYSFLVGQGSGIDQTEPRNWSSPVALSPYSDSTLYFGTNRVYKSTNRGDTWTAFSPVLATATSTGNLVYGTVTTIAPSYTNPNIVWAGTDDGNVWVTSNNGTSWTNVSASLPDRWCTRIATVNFGFWNQYYQGVNDSVAYVSFSGYKENDPLSHLWRTGNLGQTWEDISGNLPDVPINDVIAYNNPIIVNPPSKTTSETNEFEYGTRLFIGTDFGVFFSFVGWSPWEFISDGMPLAPVFDLELVEEGPPFSTFTLLAGTHGRSIYKADVTDLIFPDEVSEKSNKASGYELAQN
ncbi:hypothetical protein IT568_00305, partial [bacterium]|nr:hypothetical protein [bacterium]